ncbi:MAG: SRPBCC family protein [Planctomycetota bacterium]
MKGLKVDAVIDAPIQTVWSCAVDLDKWAETMQAITRVEKLTDGPVGVGTRFSETRVMFGREATEEMTISRFDAPTAMGFDAFSSGTKYYSEMRFEAMGHGQTRLTIEFNAEPQKLMAKVLGGLMSGLMRKHVEQALLGDLADMKAACEVEAGGAMTDGLGEEWGGEADG